MAKNNTPISDLRGQSEKQLIDKVFETKLHLQSLRSKQVIAKLKNFQEITTSRKQIARMLTVLTEKAMLAEVEDGN